MSRIKKIEPIVRQVLEEVEQARADDFLLVAEVYSRLVPECASMPFSAVMLGHKELKLPYFESIRRTGAKLRAANEELRPSLEIQLAKKKKEAEFIKYAKDTSVI